MGDMGDDFRAMKKDTERRKGMNMLNNMQFLNSIHADYEVHNGGFQLNFNTSLGIVSFYPSTNKWVLEGKVFFGTAQDMVNWMFHRLQLFDWVKRLGQWHLYHSGDDMTICGKYMLGNNYAAHIPHEQRKRCEKCWEGVTI